MIVHFYSAYDPRDPATRERMRVAKMTWAMQPWNELPVPDSLLPRMWREEDRAYPYVRDLFDHACWAESPPANAIMVYTNADVCVRSNCALMVAAIMQDTDAFYSLRRDFNHDFHAPMADGEIANGNAYVGSDFYAFRVSWWRTNRDAFPDMIVAFELWDAVLRHLIAFTNRGRIVSVPDLTYHQRHASWWEQPNNRYRLSGQLHNLKLGSDWMTVRGINPKIHGVPPQKGRQPVWA